MDMTEFEQWEKVTADSRYRWTEDVLVRRNGQGAMFYTGGIDGVYLRITKDGKLHIGTYEGAVPHIGEADFTARATKDCGSISNAFMTAVQLGGRKFLQDIFFAAQSSQDAILQRWKGTGDENDRKS